MLTWVKCENQREEEEAELVITYSFWQGILGALFVDP